MSAAAEIRDTAEQPLPVTALLIGLWERILRTGPITEDSNFFDLGGDSLMAVNMFLEIERQTGRSLPITAIYDAPTIAELAALLDESSAPKFSPLVLLKEGDAAAPLYIVHGVGGTVIEFAALGKQIGISASVYALQAQGLDGAQPPLESISDMAALYCRAIREKQPNGPYFLCGYSFGGVVAVEMAKIFEAAGEKIALLLLIDAYAHPMTWPRLSRLKMRARRAWHQMSEDAGHNGQAKFGVFVFALKAMSAKLLNAALPKHSTSGQPPAPRKTRLTQWLLNRNPNLPLPLLQTRLAAEAALSSYWPAFYPGPVIFLKARTPDPEFPENPKPIWRRLAQSLTVRVIPGSHLTVITEHAASTAAEITACVRDAQNQPSAPDVTRARATPKAPLALVKLGGRAQ